MADGVSLDFHFTSFVEKLWSMMAIFFSCPNITEPFPKGLGFSYKMLSDDKGGGDDDELLSTLGS